MALHPQHPINIISLCTGGYGLDFGVDLAMPRARSVCLVEREAFAVSRLVSAMQQDLIPQSPIWSDARTFNGRPWRGLVDGVIGGIPCQPHSLAGRRGGSDDPRDLWSVARRIVVQSGAWWCLIENVPGMLSAAKGKRAGADRVRRDLQRLGFTVEGGLFSAAEVGASHERERVFILGVADGFGCRRWRKGDAGEQPAGIDACRGSHVADGDNAGSSIAVRQSRNDGQECSATQRVCGDVVDASGQSLRAGLRSTGHWQAEQQSSDGCGALVDAASVGRRERRPEHELRRGRRTLAIDGGELDVAARVDGAMAATEERLEETDDRWSGLPLYPPQPGDAEGWRAVLDRSPGVEPSVRRVADGLATRVDELRMLGNGVVPLEAAHAVRTLVARLAARGSPGATFLSSLMEVAE